MTADHEIATRPVLPGTAPGAGAPAQQPPAEQPLAEHPPADPLATITLRPRGFAAVLAVAGLLLGLILAVVPVHVAGLDVDTPTSVSCGNTIGGVETPLVAGDLGRVDSGVLATYVSTCQQAVSTRLTLSWPLFIAGALGIAWLGVVRRERRPLTD